jgi:hypothetical protein
LWVSKDLVHKGSGSLRVRSSDHPKRHGSVFVLFFPQ